MIYRFRTRSYLFEKEEYSVKVSDELYAICCAFAIIKKDGRQLIRKASYLLEHTPEYTSCDCINKSCPSLEELLRISAGEYFLYINFISQNSLNSPHYDMIVSAEERDFCANFDRSNKGSRNIPTESETCQK